MRAVDVCIYMLLVEYGLIIFVSLAEVDSTTISTSGLSKCEGIDFNEFLSLHDDLGVWERMRTELEDEKEHVTGTLAAMDMVRSNRSLVDIQDLPRGMPVDDMIDLIGMDEEGRLERATQVEEWLEVVSDNLSEVSRKASDLEAGKLAAANSLLFDVEIEFTLIKDRIERLTGLSQSLVHKSVIITRQSTAILTWAEAEFPEKVAPGSGDSGLVERLAGAVGPLFRGFLKLPAASEFQGSVYSRAVNRAVDSITRESGAGVNRRLGGELAALCRRITQTALDEILKESKKVDAQLADLEDDRTANRACAKYIDSFLY